MVNLLSGLPTAELPTQVRFLVLSTCFKLYAVQRMKTEEHVVSLT